jgi:hypothetical protein
LGDHPLTDSRLRAECSLNFVERPLDHVECSLNHVECSLDHVECSLDRVNCSHIRVERFPNIQGVLLRAQGEVCAEQAIGYDP